MATFSLLQAALLFCVALAAAQGSDLKALKHKGCYWSRPTNFVIGGFSKTEVQRQKCLDTCTQRGQQWIAFGSVNCLCGNTAPRYHQVDNNRCNAQCVGILDGDCIKQPKNNYAFGEDDELYAVFSIPSIANDETNRLLSHHRQGPLIHATESKQLATNKGKVGKITAQGCYSISGRSSMLMKVLIHDDDSRRECAKVCAQDGRPLALISGNECSCGTMYPARDAAAGSDKCYMPCLSEGDDRCQRDSEYNPARHDPYTAVYNTGLGLDVETLPSVATELPSSEKTSPKHTEPNGHPGQACYRRVPASPVYKVFAGNSPMLCHRYCQRKGHMYAITWHQICYCNNEYPDKPQRNKKTSSRAVIKIMC